MGMKTAGFIFCIKNIIDTFNLKGIFLLASATTRPPRSSPKFGKSIQFQ
jgi:hypothetical protein